MSETTAKERRFKMMQDHLTDRVYEPTYTETEEAKNIEHLRTIENTFRKYKYHTSARLKKSIDMSSTLQGKEFYEKILNIDKSEKPVKEFEIDIPDVDSLGLKELENKAAKNGIHIYDIKTESYLDDKNRKIVFKVKEDKEPEFKKKFENIKTQLENKGLKINPHNDKSKLKNK
jgi:hypothetical protein